MLLRIILFCELLSKFIAEAGFRGSSISCVCSTTQCVEHHARHCNTTGMCFSQYLDRRDGSHPVVRGCISSKTPLLCENRRPAIAGGSWPVLLCCNSDNCNADVVPTAPPWLAKDDGKEAEEDGKRDSGELLNHQDRIPDSTSSTNSTSNLLGPGTNDTGSPNFLDEPDSQSPSRTRTRFLPHIVSPVYISVLVLGVISLAIIGAVAAIVLRRNNRFYVEQYGALEHHPGCPKHPLGSRTSCGHPVVQCDCDSEVESLSQCSQPFVHVIYDHQPSNNT